jgi:hypothetical protein
MSGNPRWYPDGQGWAAAPPPPKIPPMPSEPPGPPGSIGPAFTVRPRPPAPRRGGAHRLRRRVSPPLVAAVAVAVVGALVAGGLLLFRQQGGQAPDNEAVASTSTAVADQAATPSPAGTTPGAGTVTASGGTGAATPSAVSPSDDRKPPKGFELADDPEGFSLFVPGGWKREEQSDQIFYTPDGFEHMIMIRVTADDGLTPLERMRDFDKSLSTSRQDYKQLRLAVAADGTDSAELEYTYKDPKFGARHVVDRAFRSPDGATMYFLLSAGPAKAFPDTLKRFTQAVKSFCPDGYLCTSSTAPSPLQ